MYKSEKRVEKFEIILTRASGGGYHFSGIAKKALFMGKGIEIY